jgi:hypothetical protein
MTGKSKAIFRRGERRRSIHWSRYDLNEGRQVIFFIAHGRKQLSAASKVKPYSMSYETYHSSQRRSNDA